MRQYYGIFDKKTASFPFPPFQAINLEDALRTVKMSLDKPSPVTKFPADYALYFQSHYDEITGQFQPPATGVPQFTEEIVNLLEGMNNPVPPKKEK